MTDNLVLCGVLIHSVPGQKEALARELGQMPGTEVHHKTEDGRLIVTVEADSQKKASQVLTDVQSMPAVAAASLVYHHFE